MQTPSHPILSCEETREFEKILFNGEEAGEWAAMQRAGRAVGQAVLDDFKEIGGFNSDGHVVVLAGKGHNGGDALLAVREILAHHPRASASVLFVYGEHALRPLALQAYQALVHAAGARVSLLAGTGAWPARVDLCLDGVFGFQFRPPLDARAAAVLRFANEARITLRAAVDLPSGGNEPDAFRADFTYATGVMKLPLLSVTNAGRVRYLDLGFFEARAAEKMDFGAVTNRVLTSDVLMPLRGLRPPRSDKRTYGHLFVMGGSRDFSGAVLMTVMAALRSGAGLVTAFAPAAMIPAFAARAPEAIWVGWPEGPEGGLSREGMDLLRARLGRATAMVVGPGLGAGDEAIALATEVAKLVEVPMVIDADALRPEVVRARAGRATICTPHAGEFERLGCGADLATAGHDLRATIVLKGPVTRICEGDRIYHSVRGGPVLARGGSGDILAGLIGGLLAQRPVAPLWAASAGVVWHGCAADRLAQKHGQVAVHTTGLLEHLAESLRADP